MEKYIGHYLKPAASLFYIKKQLIKVFKVVREESGNIVRIGYVAGILNSDGPLYFESNRKKLLNYTEELRSVHKFSIFSAVDVFSAEIYERLKEMSLPFEQREIKMRFFWREILESGYVTDIFMTPRWEKSKGAYDEHETAKRIGLRIYYYGKQYSH